MGKGYAHHVALPVVSFFTEKKMKHTPYMYLNTNYHKNSR